MDAISSLLTRFRVDTRTFYSGPLCNETAEYGHDQAGHIHIIHDGQVHLEVRGSLHRSITGPAVVLLTNPVPHRLRPGEHPPRLSCARLEADGFENHPLLRILPEVTITGGQAQRNMAALLEWLEVEGEQSQPGRRAAMDRMFELVLICSLRQFIASSHARPSLLQGLAHPGLARALAVIHEYPERRWTLAALAAQAYMSRSSFAESFQRLLGCTPVAYLRQWRIGLVQQGLRAGTSLTVLAEQVGYEDVSALRRAFRKSVGCAPTDWLRTQSSLDR